ncbi:sigma-54-dependent transcriptional regulator [Aerobium aerolatum]|uniref:Two-component system, NtrC family, C4-dicarboxylate transport response regulator DctD n=1 Tax=Aquamicrobium aerolatum DSM 21857 TaxID=1121003 RepID=A0A1I3Q5T2_9HYPH|nr:sigma-54 dependent transcriptional regulator [Aquamicrobium aerolatum]SFJ29218.1 two-component system, NtrC family, C4-dicarboxylate transport response regulator DctD [Aquamicrobium aerolatum DSM 21857]
MKSPSVLLVDDEEDIRHSTAQALELAGLTVHEFASAEQALDYITPGFRGVVVSDIRMPGLDGMTLLSRIHDIDADIPVILVTGHGDVQLAVRAIRAGAYDFLEKPFATQHLTDIVRRGLDRRSLVLENRLLRAAAGHPDDIETRLPGRSSAMIDLRFRLRAVAPTDADILIVGDTGVGKEVVARAIHDISGRADRPLVAINCAALPENLIESELFGHEAGAFPGALRTRYGKFEHARGGTVLLDEIGSMPADLQAKLLRVIQERVIVRLGSNEPIPLDVRFIATSKVELEEEVNAGRFRADLLYRLNVVTLRVPQLAERREDVPILFLQLVREAAGRHRRDMIDVPAKLLETLAQHDWPGNVRELRNAADRYLLGLGIGTLDPTATGNSSDKLADQVARFERAIIASALQAHGGSLKPVYEMLGISRKTLYEKMQRYALDKHALTAGDKPDRSE